MTTVAFQGLRVRNKRSPEAPAPGLDHHDLRVHGSDETGSAGGLAAVVCNLEDRHIKIRRGQRCRGGPVPRIGTDRASPLDLYLLHRPEKEAVVSVLQA